MSCRKEESFKATLPPTATPRSNRSNVTMKRGNVKSRKSLFENARKALKRPALTRFPSTHSLVDTPRVVTSTKVKKLKCRRSISLQDLSPTFEKNVTFRRNVSTIGESLDILDSPMAKLESPIQDENKRQHILMKVYCEFLKNAWRKSKTRQESEHERLIVADSKIENMTIQLNALKKFLCADRKIISNLTEDIIKYKKYSVTCSNENQKLYSENNSLEETIAFLKDEKCQLEMEVMNCKNKCQKIELEASSFENQLKKEKEDLAHLKSGNKLLLDKIGELRKDNFANRSEISHLTKDAQTMQHELRNQQNIIRHTEEKSNKDLKKLKEIEGKVSQLENELQSVHLLNTSLCLEVSQFEKALKEKTKLAEELERTLQQNYVTIVELNTALETVSSQTWKSKFFSAITTALQIPIVALKVGAAPNTIYLE